MGYCGYFGYCDEQISHASKLGSSNAYPPDASQFEEDLACAVLVFEVFLFCDLTSRALHPIGIENGHFGPGHFGPKQQPTSK